MHLTTAQQDHYTPVVGAFGLSLGSSLTSEKGGLSTMSKTTRLPVNSSSDSGLLFASSMTTIAETICCRNHDERERMVLERGHTCGSWCKTWSRHSKIVAESCLQAPVDGSDLVRRGDHSLNNDSSVHRVQVCEDTGCLTNDDEEIASAFGDSEWP